MGGMKLANAALFPPPALLLLLLLLPTTTTTTTTTTHERVACLNGDFSPLPPVIP
jgi:hypothetical protein